VKNACGVRDLAGKRNNARLPHKLMGSGNSQQNRRVAAFAHRVCD
jgi:hypothetical protein